ncbi:hypothetical protein PoB_004226200 [Plakobranchus ocellatus]|uniref:Reverse transcriptase domain-containing protein n=1 Tax=Plakobranchus ocellatus TaxID=259542 RepID=A0AAV4B8D7_9GAST|nr:hypothetical protein PoB_004226200 [Plakobranchus ocellatus]
MFWEQTAAMRVENKTSTFQDTKRGVRQGCGLSPDLFSFYSEIILRNLENHPGINKNAPDTLDRKKKIEIVLNEANKRRSLVRTIRKRQATFLGHVMRREKLEHLVTTGKLEGKRSRGSQREKITDGLATCLGPGKVLDILAAVKDRDLWRDMIANAYKQGT